MGNCGLKNPPKKKLNKVQALYISRNNPPTKKRSTSGIGAGNPEEINLTKQQEIKLSVLQNKIELIPDHQSFLKNSNFEENITLAFASKTSYLAFKDNTGVVLIENGKATYSKFFEPLHPVSTCLGAVYLNGMYYIAIAHQSGIYSLDPTKKSEGMVLFKKFNFPLIIKPVMIKPLKVGLWGKILVVMANNFSSTQSSEITIKFVPVGDPGGEEDNCTQIRLGEESRTGFIEKFVYNEVIGKDKDYLLALTSRGNILCYKFWFAADHGYSRSSENDSSVQFGQIDTFNQIAQNLSNSLGESALSLDVCENSEMVWVFTKDRDSKLKSLFILDFEKGKQSLRQAVDLAQSSLSFLSTTRFGGYCPSKRLMLMVGMTSDFPSSQLIFLVFDKKSNRLMELSDQRADMEGFIAHEFVFCDGMLFSANQTNQLLCLEVKVGADRRI